MKNIENRFWAKRTLIWDFAISDLKIRYRSSVLGLVWSFLEPLLLLTVLYIVFTNIFRSEIELFPLYLLLGIIMWNMVVKGTQLGLGSVSSRRGIFLHMYIPKGIPPISAGLTSLMMLIFEMIILGAFMVAFQFLPSFTIIILPLILILEFILVVGISLGLSVLSVRFKDIQIIWGIILHAGFFLTPIFYKIDILPESIQRIIVLNPMVSILNMARDVTLYGKIPLGEDVIMAVGITFLIFGIGYGVFKKLSPRIMEEL